MGDDGASTFACRMTQGIFLLVIMIEKEQCCVSPRRESCDAKVGRGRTLSDAWDANKLDSFCGNSMATGGS